MMIEKLPPVVPAQWAFTRMRDLRDAETASNQIQVAFARYIEAHEQPPVDPLYEALRAVVEMGRYDTREQTELLRSELRIRGIEIGGAK